MLLKHLTVQNFRNFDKQTLAFNPFLTVIIGQNAAGKTNLLEAIHTALYGVGFRESKEEELINFEHNAPPATVAVVFGEGDSSLEFKIVLLKKEGNTQKSFFIAKSKKTLRAYRREAASAVLFAPSQIEILTGSPNSRREYFNRVLFSFDLEYRKRLSNYEQAIRRRNKLLEAFVDQRSAIKELSFWDSYLEREGKYVVDKRQEYVDFANKHPNVDHYIFSLEYLKNEFTQQKAKERLELELKIKRTTIGPQKDDFVIWIKNNKNLPAGRQGKNVHHFGSRSEQRLSIFWLKLNEIYFHEEILKKRPLLLLDDIFSELDSKNKALVLDLIQKYQSVATTTETEILELAATPKSIIKI